MMKLMNRSWGTRWGFFILSTLVLVFGTVFYYQSALAAAELTLTPITWDIIGLDSNDESSGPNHFPVGARVCNTGDEAATNVTSTFEWDSTNSDIYLRPGSLASFTGGNAVASLGTGECVDFYYEVEVDRNDSARNTDREYHITATADDLATVSTPTPRKLFVEYLISQSRNATLDIKLDGVSVPAGGTMALVVGGTYEIELVASTATQGYNQIESFINFTNTIFRINSVVTDYNAYPTPHTDDDWDNKLYADGCTWENDPNSPNFQSCLGTGKYGGDVTVTYNITIIGGAGSTETLSSLIYDFSGSSFHYNADYSTSARFAAIIDPTTATIEKVFTPSTTGVGGVSTLSFTLHNPNSVPLTGANFTDTFPTDPDAMVVATPATYSTSGCGSPTFAPVAGAASISFSDGTIPANGSCIVSVKVTVPTAGTYNNTSSNLFIGAADTGDDASASLDVTTDPVPVCTPGLELARWEFNGTTLDPTFQSSRVITATASYIGSGLSAVNTTVGNPINSWGAQGGWAADATGYPNAGASPYFDIYLDSSQFTGVSLAYDFVIEGNWANSANNYLYTYSNADSGGFTTLDTHTGFDGNDPFALRGPLTAASTGSSTTAFRINAVGQQRPTAELVLDNIVITGCGVPEPPTLTKVFSPDPIAVDGASTLTFNLTNENNVALTGVRFMDSLPAGLEVAATPNANTTCGGTPTWAPANLDTALVFGDPIGATIPARVGTTNGSCTISVDVKATTSGAHQNVSGFIYSTQTVTNTTSTGSGSDSLTAILPPQISKMFNLASILENGVSTLSFVITNPNPDFELTGVQFSDTFPVLPGNMVVATPATFSTSGCGTPTFTPVAGVGSVSFTNGTIAAGGNCTVQVDVTAPTIGIYNNTSGAVSADIVSGTDTASDSLEVTAAHPAISILKQVSTSDTGPWTTFVSVPLGTNIYYQFTVENTGDVALTGVTVTDPTLEPPSPYVVCDIGALALYQVTTCAFGPVSAAAGWNYNTANSHGTYSSSDYDSEDSTASYATTGLSLVKSIYETAFTAAGDVLHYSYVVENTGAAPLQGPVAIADDKSTDETCPPVNSIGDNDNWLDPGESITCTATYTVVAGDVTATAVTNIASATVDGVTSNQDTVTVNLETSDYGDLPASYNVTLQTNDGPRHTRSSGSVLRLGPDLSIDTDGQEDPAADGDTFDDGVFRDMTDRWTNGATVDIDLYLEGSGLADVGIWIDWDNSGSFSPSEFFGFTGLTVGSLSTVQVTVPDSSTYTVGDTLNVRVRAFVPASIPGGSLDSGDFVGLANDGEVEDYQWDFSDPNAVNLADFSAQSLEMGWVAALAALFILGTGVFFVVLRRQKTSVCIHR